MTNLISIRQRHGLTLLLALILQLPLLVQATEPLPSWNDGPAKKSIVEFVRAVATPSTRDYVKPSERIAVFGNDGTLWTEQPTYFQVLFAFDEIKRLTPQHPEWKTEQPFKAVLENGHKGLGESGMDDLLKIVGATRTGITTEAFMDNAKTWLSRARHPRTGKPYTEMIYQPMLEMLDYLRSQDFRTYIVSGGDTTFMRAFAKVVFYGVPPKQVIGTRAMTRNAMQDRNIRWSLRRDSSRQKTQRPRRSATRRTPTGRRLSGVGGLAAIVDSQW
ncbi:hypothetical protein PS723_05922 [Pseudomonas fluorescens]|uniref:Nonspecific acid phosphatase n=1 Tax=Pseudomonas fluorescens TaxID=294 RepID=A0A5E7FRG3_PSEFL|nr:hypothetical protein PS723_05922 [Pseudomonas fluorescens]